MANEFGFSLLSEKELRTKEEQLAIKIEETLKEIDRQKNKLHELREMILPLLENLTKDPEKTYILWEDRVPKVKQFIQQINQLVDE